MSAPQTNTAPNPPTEAAPTPSEKRKPAPRTPQQQSAAIRARLRFTGWKLYGMLVGAFSVVLASYAMSFESLRHLAQLIGWGNYLSCGLPIILDVYAAVASLFWFGFGAASQKVRRDAMVNTVFSGVLSVAGNALLHVMLTGTFVSEVEQTAPVKDLPEFNGVHFFNVNPVIAVLVGMVPPIINVSVVHLLSKFALEVDEFDADLAIQTGDAKPDKPIVVTGRPAAPRPEVKPAAAVEAPAARPELPAAPAPTPTRTVVPIGEGNDRRQQRDDVRMKLALVEFARLEDAGIDLSQPGLNKQIMEKLGVSERSVLNWKKIYNQQKASSDAREASG